MLFKMGSFLILIFQLGGGVQTEASNLHSSNPEGGFVYRGPKIKDAQRHS